MVFGTTPARLIEDSRHAPHERLPQQEQQSADGAVGQLGPGVAPFGDVAEVFRLSRSRQHQRAAT
jgi:hypothetical protein